MPRLVRNPILWAGFALVAIGSGNWTNGKIKIAEYDAIVAQRASQPALASPAEYRNLNARTNESLLRPLRPRLTTRTVAEGKREFYSVVLMGGRLLTLLGALILIVSLLLERRRARERGVSAGSALS